MKKHYLFSFVTSMSRMTTGILIVFILARIFSLEDYGVYNYALVLGNLFATIVEYGYNTRLTKVLAKKSTMISIYTTQTAFLKILLFLSGFIVMCIYLELNDSFSFKTKLSIIFIAIAVVLNSIVLHFCIPYKALKKFDIETKFSLINNVPTFIVIVLVAFFSRSIFLTSIGLLSIKTLVLIFVIFTFNKDFKLTFKKFKILKELRETLPYALMTIIGGMYLNFDTVIIEKFVSIEEIGIYRSGINLILASTIILTIINNVVLPTISAFKTKELVLKSSIKFNVRIILLGLLVTILFFLFKKHIILILFGEKFLILINYSYYIMAILFLRYVGNIYGLLLTISNKQKIRVLCVALTLVLILGLDFILVPTMMIEGAFISMLIGHIFLIGLYIYFTFCEYNSFLFKIKKYD